LGEIECPNPVKTSNNVAVAKTDAAHPFNLLRTRRNRPSNRTAEKRDKLAPPHRCPRWHAERSRSVSTRTGSLEGVPECSMSALGQKQTYAPQKAMSATFNSGRESGFPQNVMSALPPESGRVQCN
jgi:hypothetical protein